MISNDILMIGGTCMNTSRQNTQQRIILPAAALLLALLMALASPYGAHAANLVGPSLNATLLYYEPIPASPGSVLDVYIQIANDGDIAKDVVVRFHDNDPFSLDSEMERVKTTGSIPGQENFLVKYKVRVDEDASPGTSYLKLELSVGNTANVQTFLLPIDVTGSTISLGLASVDFTPETIAPGSTGELSITLQNNADIKVTSGTISLGLSDLDIVPVSGSNIRRFPEIPSGDSHTFTFKLAPSPSMAPGIYKIPVTVAYKDQTGASYSQDGFVGMSVGADPELLIYVEQSSVDSKTFEGEVVVKFVNKGLTGVKLLEMEVLPSDKVTVTSESSKIYIGNIDVDDYESGNFNVKLTDDAASLPIRISYRDALNRPYEQRVDLKLMTSNANGDSSSRWYIWVFVIVIIGAAVWYFMKRQRKTGK